MSQAFERLKIAVWAIGRNITNRFRHQPKTGKVLLIFQQVFGDSIIALPALRGYVDLYYKQKRYDITLLALHYIGLCPYTYQRQQVYFVGEGNECQFTVSNRTQNYEICI